MPEAWEGHRVELEETLAHLANAHACKLAEDFVTKIVQAMVVRASAGAVKLANGQPAPVTVDFGAELERPTNAVVLDRLHAEHHAFETEPILIDALHPPRLHELIASLDAGKVGEHG